MSCCCCCCCCCSDLLDANNCDTCFGTKRDLPTLWREFGTGVMQAIPSTIEEGAVVALTTGSTMPSVGVVTNVSRGSSRGGCSFAPRRAGERLMEERAKGVETNRSSSSSPSLTGMRTNLRFGVVRARLLLALPFFTVMFYFLTRDIQRHVVFIL